MSCWCFLNYFPLNKRVCQSIPVLTTCLQLALLTQRAVIRHFNKVYFRFHWRRLKILNLFIFGNKHFQYCRLMIMCIDPYIVKFSITMHLCTDGLFHPYVLDTFKMSASSATHKRDKCGVFIYSTWMIW